MQNVRLLLSMVVGVCGVGCGAQEGAVLQTSQASQTTALTLPFPDDYFGMYVARDAGTRADAAEGCAKWTDGYAAAWDALQSTPQFAQLAATGPWQKTQELRDAYAGSGCFTSGPILSQPSADCKAEFDRLVAAWDATERTTEFHVLIGDAANHDVYATWTNGVAYKCFLDS